MKRSQAKLEVQVPPGVQRINKLSPKGDFLQQNCSPDIIISPGSRISITRKLPYIVLLRSDLLTSNIKNIPTAIKLVGGKRLTYFSDTLQLNGIENV